MLTLRLLSRSCQFLCLCICVSIAIFFSIGQNIHIDTDLKSMSPKIVDDAGVQQAIGSLSRSIEKRFTLALYSEDLDELEEAFDTFLAETEEHHQHFSFIDTLDSLDTYTNILDEHRFHLLTSEQRQELENIEKTALFSQAERRLHDVSSSFQLFRFSHDPFGYLSDFVLASGSNSTANEDEFIEIHEEGKTRYYVTASFSIQGNALALDVQQEIKKSLEEIENSIQTQYPTVSFLHSGIIFFATDAAQKSKADISLISTGSSIGILILLMSVFRSFKILIFPGVSIGIGIGFAFTVSHLLFSSVHIITIVFGAGLIGVVIDYALHYIYHQKPEEKEASAKQLHKALAFSLITSLIGYGALALSDLESLRRVALFSGLGLFGAWISVIALGPFLIPKDLKSSDQLFAVILRHTSSFLEKLHKVLFACAMLVLLAGSYWIATSGLKSSDSPRVFFNINQQLLSEEKQVNKLISSYEPGTYLIVRGKAIQDVYDEISKLPDDEVSEAGIRPLGIHRLIPSPEDQLRNYLTQRPLYEENALLLEYLGQKGVNEEEINSLSEQYKAAKEQTLTPSSLLTALGENAPPLWVSGEEWLYSFILVPKAYDSGGLETVASNESNIFFVNTAKMAEETIKKQRESALKLILAALTFVALIVFLRYRRIRSLTLVLVPTCAIVLTIVLLQLLGVPLTLFHVMALFLVLGLGMDYVIFVSELPTHSNSTTLYAVILSAITSLLSFGLLSASSLPVVSAFGMTVLIGNTLNLLGTIFLAKQQSNNNHDNEKTVLS